VEPLPGDISGRNDGVVHWVLTPITVYKIVNSDGCVRPTITIHKVFWVHYLFSSMSSNHLSQLLPCLITRCWLTDPQTHHLFAKESKTTVFF
jgi:hypothetical protein